MRRPSRKIIQKQIKRLDLKSGDDIPCLVKYYKKRDVTKLQQGYTKLTGPYFWVYQKAWEFRGQDLNCDMVWAVKRKPGKKDVGSRKQKKAKYRLDRNRRKYWHKRREEQARIDMNNAAYALFKEITRLRQD